jgi:hypothetical protein
MVEAGAELALPLDHLVDEAKSRIIDRPNSR